VNTFEQGGRDHAQGVEMGLPHSAKLPMARECHGQNQHTTHHIVVDDRPMLTGLHGMSQGTRYEQIASRQGFENSR